MEQLVQDVVQGMVNLLTFKSHCNKTSILAFVHINNFDHLGHPPSLIRVVTVCMKIA